MKRRHSNSELRSSGGHAPVGDTQTGDLEREETVTHPKLLNLSLHVVVGMAAGPSLVQWIPAFCASLATHTHTPLLILPLDRLDPHSSESTGLHRKMN